MKMSSVKIIALRKNRKKLLEHLQNCSLVHIRDGDGNEGFSQTDMTSQIKHFERNAELCERALKILDNASPQKGGMLKSFKGRRIIDPDEIGAIAKNSPRILTVCNKITELQKQIADCSAEIVRVRNQMAQLVPWKNLDIPMNTPDTATTAVIIGSLPRQYDETELSTEIAEKAPGLIFEYEIVYSSPEITCIVFLSPKRERETAESVLRSMGFSGILNPTSKTPSVKYDDYKKRLEGLKKKIDDAEAAIKDFADKRDSISDTEDYFNTRIEKYSVISRLDQTDNVFVLYGYIPTEDIGRLRELCAGFEPCVVECEDSDTDETPVKLKNNSFTSPAENIVTMYSPPSHADIDPTPILAFFFYFFFGMMFSDAGYGLVMVIATTLMLKIFKPDKKMRSNIKLFQYCGIFTILWGLVFGSIFGDAPAVIYGMLTGKEITMAQLLPWPILDTQKDALMIMIMSIGFGLVHILVGMGCKFYVCIKQKQYAEAFFDTGFWMLMLVGFAVLAVGMATTPVLIYIGAGIAALCAVGLILTGGRDKKNIFAKLIGGVASLYDITSYVSDLLSYSRLLALGLTTGVMAQVFNKISAMLGTNALGMIFMVLIFIAGHLITIGLNALGSYVHTMRLQYVEMFSKFYDGGGKEFTPFSVKSNNFKTKNSDE